MSLLECKKLSIGYQNKVVCKDISFKVERGEYVCVIGENGSGKSTMLKTILGLNKAISGKIIFDDDFNKSAIGYLPQQSGIQKDFPATVKEIVMSGFLGKIGLRPFYNRKEKDKATAIMRELEILEFQKKSMRDLSGGQQQRVLLARALCASDELLIMDEPINNLDAKSMKSFYKLISKLNRENNITIMLVTHDIEKVIKDVNHIIYLKDNTLKFSGTQRDFLNSEYAKNYGVEVE